MCIRDRSILQRFFGGHVVVSVRILSNLFDILTTVLGDDTIECLSSLENMLGSDLDVSRLTFGSSEWLVDHDLSMWECIPLPFCTPT